MNNQNHSAKNRMKRGLTFYIISTFILSAFLFLLCAAFLFVYYSYQLPDFKPLKDRHLNAYSTVYSENDEVVGKFLMENRIPISYEKIPKQLVNAFI
jgi:penicillin-binding protein 1A